MSFRFRSRSRRALMALVGVAALSVGVPSTWSAPAPKSAPAASGAPVGVNSYIVILKDAVAGPSAVAARHAQKYGARATKVYGTALKGYAAKIPADRVDALRADPDVRFVTPDTEVQATDQLLGTGVHRINAQNKVDKGAGVNVAVIDTGIDLNHPDLAANVVGGVNCSSGSKRGYDDGNGHGTHVAGIIAALDNGIGVVGVAPDAKLWAVRVLDNNGSGAMSDVVCGIDFVDSMSPAKGGPIAVANMSLGGLGYDDGNCGNTNGDPMHQAICRSVADGVSFVVAAGNAGMDISQSLTFVPASYDEVITVSALADSDGRPCGLGTATSYASDDTFAAFSNYARSATDIGHLVGAPGVGIYSTWMGGTYSTHSGTSMASPHVAGAAALYIAGHPGTPPAGVLVAFKALGEPATNFNGECTGAVGGKGKGAKAGRSSHTDPMGIHPEAVVRADSL